MSSLLSRITISNIYFNNFKVIVLNRELNSFKSVELEHKIGILKITAIWAFSESAFGGIIHALTIPLRGLFISSAAVLFISLIALFSKKDQRNS